MPRTIRTNISVPPPVDMPPADPTRDEVVYSLQQRNAYLEDLIADRIAPLLPAKNELGKWDIRFCQLCPTARMRRVPCPHIEIVEIHDERKALRARLQTGSY